MAEYKVAQDVEAEDKLIGPFSFRQFIYLIIAAVAVAVCIVIGLFAVPADSEDIFVDIFQRAVSAARFFVSKTMD